MIDLNKARSEWIARAIKQSEQLAVIAAATRSDDVARDLVRHIDRITEQAVRMKRTARG